MGHQLGTIIAEEDRWRVSSVGQSSSEPPSLLQSKRLTRKDNTRSGYLGRGKKPETLVLDYWYIPNTILDALQTYTDDMKKENCFGLWYPTTSLWCRSGQVGVIQR